MSEYDIVFFMGMFAGIVLAFVLLYLYVRSLIKEVVSEIDRHIDQVKDNLMPVIIERANGELYCYTEKDRQFICQGADMIEIKKAFKTRYPDKTAYLAGGEDELIKELREQLKESNETGTSK